LKKLLKILILILDVVTQNHNSSTLEAEAGRQQVQGQPRLLGKFQASLGYTEKPIFKKKAFKNEREKPRILNFL
jgi:hypothetical protein